MTKTNTKWLTKREDAEGHVFPVDDMNDSARISLTALCDDSFLVDHLEDTPPRTFCQACLVRLGELIPDESRWQTGG